MRDHNRHLGCGLWIVGLFVALFAGEWLLLWLVVRALPEEQLIQGVTLVITLTIAAGWAAVYVRVQRRSR